MNKIKIWLPRILCISYIVFISIFAIDVFSEGYNFLETIIALFMHLIPSFVLIACLFIAWRKPQAGGSIFITLGLLLSWFLHARGKPMGFLIISIPVLLIGVLFLFSEARK